MQRYFKIPFTLFNYSKSEHEKKKKKQGEYHSETKKKRNFFSQVTQPHL